MKCHLDT